MGRLNEKVAIVTGAGQGIGRSIALEVAHEGAKVVVADINLETMKYTVEEIKNLGIDSTGINTDITNPREVEQLAKKTVERFQAIDILVNNAGIYPHREFMELTVDEWNKVLQVNMTGSFNCIQAVTPQMIKQGSGKIINITSIAGPLIGFPGLTHYCASKAGILGLTRGTALELAPYNINVNAIAAGAIRTPATGEEFIKHVEEKAPLRRIGEPEDIAKAVVYLASEDSSYITGQLLVADGGITIQW